MVVNRRKKAVKYRGGSTHGGGARKKRRGAGSRGGKGRAGTGKRAGQKKAGMPLQLGRRGFTSKHPAPPMNVVNLDYFTPEKVAHLLIQKKAGEEQGMLVVDLTALGFQKLLGAGTVRRKLKILCHSCSSKAKEKVEAAGGEVVQLPAGEKVVVKEK